MPRYYIITIITIIMINQVTTVSPWACQFMSITVSLRWWWPDINMDIIEGLQVSICRISYSVIRFVFILCIISYSSAVASFIIVYLLACLFIILYTQRKQATTSLAAVPSSTNSDNLGMMTDDDKNRWFQRASGLAQSQRASGVPGGVCSCFIRITI